MKKLICITAALLALGACSKEDINKDTLPPITQEGLNTFGCIINGRVLIPKDGQASIGGGAGADGMVVRYLKDSMTNYEGENVRPPFFEVSVSNYGNKERDLIYIYVPSLDHEGEYSLFASNGYTGIDSPPHAHAFANIYNSNDKRQYRYLSFDQAGTITVTRLDTLNTVISGTFSLKIIDAATGQDTIEVTDGRFDINWRTLNQD